MSDTAAFCGKCGAAIAPSSVPTATILSAPLPPEPLSPPEAEPGSFAEHDGAHNAAKTNGARPDMLRDIRLLGTAAPNEAYVGARLQYDRQGEQFDIFTLFSRAMAQSVAQGRAAAISFLIFPGFFPLGILVYVIFRNAQAIFYLYLLALLAGCAVLWLAPYFRRHHFVISEWKLSLDGKGSSADQVFEHIAHAVVDRSAPMQYRARPLPGAGQTCLHLKLGSYQAYVSCFAFGDDLYIGWTLWSSATWKELHEGMIPAWKLLLFRPYYVYLETIASRRGDSYEVGWMHSLDIAKAMRECLHSVTRQGVDAAVGAVPFAGAGTIGSVVPVGDGVAFAGTAMTLPTTSRS